VAAAAAATTTSPDARRKGRFFGAGDSFASSGRAAGSSSLRTASRGRGGSSFVRDASVASSSREPSQACAPPWRDNGQGSPDAADDDTTATKHLHCSSTLRTLSSQFDLSSGLSHVLYGGASRASDASVGRRTERQPKLHGCDADDDRPSYMGSTHSVVHRVRAFAAYRRARPDADGFVRDDDDGFDTASGRPVFVGTDETTYGADDSLDDGSIAPDCSWAPATPRGRHRRRCTTPAGPRERRLLERFVKGEATGTTPHGGCGRLSDADADADASVEGGCRPGTRGEIDRSIADTVAFPRVPPLLLPMKLGAASLRKQSPTVVSERVRRDDDLGLRLLVWPPRCADDDDTPRRPATTATRWRDLDPYMAAALADGWDGGSTCRTSHSAHRARRPRTTTSIAMESRFPYVESDDDGDGYHPPRPLLVPWTR